MLRIEYPDLRTLDPISRGLKLWKPFLFSEFPFELRTLDPISRGLKLNFGQLRSVCVAYSEHLTRLIGD